MMTFSRQLLRELRGSPLTVLLACILLEQEGCTPITAQAIKDATGYRDHTVTDALRTLESPERQYIRRTKNGWRLVQDGFQLPLEIRENRENREFLALDSSSSRREPQSFLLEEEEEDKNREIRENRENREYEPNHDGKHYRDNLVLLARLGVGEPKRTHLARLKHVTPDFIQAHFDAIANTSLPIGTAIYRIEHKWTSDPGLLPPAPAQKTSYRRYSEGIFFNKENE